MHSHMLDPNLYNPSKIPIVNNKVDLNSITLLDIIVDILSRFDLIFLVEFPTSFSAKELQKAMGDSFKLDPKSMGNKETCCIMHRKEIQISGEITENIFHSTGSKTYFIKHTPSSLKLEYQGWVFVTSTVHFRPISTGLNLTELKTFFDGKVQELIAEKLKINEPFDHIILGFLKILLFN